MKNRHATRLTLACVLVCLTAVLAAGARASRVAPAPAPEPARSAEPAPALGLQTFNLADFGAVGDGQTDAGPALQAALDAVIAAGGGTLNVPAGRYAIVTPVLAIGPLSFDVPLEIRGVPSTTPIAGPHDGGYALTRGLNLTSEFYPRTGGSASAVTFWNFRSLLIQDIAFVGTAGASTDALTTVDMANAVDAVIRHCEFYGLISLVPNGSIIRAQRTHLSIQQTAFLGCTANSGYYTPVVQNWDWKGITVEDTIFADYGQRPELYGKLGYGAAHCWVSVGHPAQRTPDSPRREVVIRNVMLDEGGWQGITVHPARYQYYFEPIDLFYATNLYVNVSNFWQTGLSLSGTRQGLVENSLFTWAERADSAIHSVDLQDIVIDRVRTEKSASRLRADDRTARLTVIDSTYQDLASAAAQTIVLTPATADDDPVRYVRARFESVLGRGPDAAAHYYWSRKLLDCGADSACVTSQRAALAAYLAANPVPTFAINGRAADEAGQPLSGVAVTLSGSQSSQTTTAADGSYGFGRLPTSGVYTVTAGTKRHYTFTAPARTVATPAGGQTVDFPARLNRYAVGGRLLDERGRAIQGATLTLSGAQAAAATTDANGNYAFTGLAAGGNYTVTASSTRYSFSAASQSFTDLDGDKTANFNGTSLFYTVAGQVVDSANRPVTGLSLALTGGKTATAATNAQGNFVFADLPRGGSFTVTPAKLLGHTFVPASRTFDNLTADQTTAFTAVPTDFKISGRVTSGGAGLAGVTVTLSGSKSGAATTDSAGAYSFSVPAHGDFTVTPSKTHYTFDRAGASFSGVNADRTADFAATLNRHRLGGSVRRPDGLAMAGVTVTLSGGQAGTATTDANGAYTFANLPAGASYTV
ncbi:MAG TPA: carboxypeptidase regulatory-like domain-containing protein, partial [Pyrinomonadaceae bacterium]